MEKRLYKDKIMMIGNVLLLMTTSRSIKTKLFILKLVIVAKMIITVNWEFVKFNLLKKINFIIMMLDHIINTHIMKMYAIQEKKEIIQVLSCLKTKRVLSISYSMVIKTIFICQKPLQEKLLNFSQIFQKEHGPLDLHLVKLVKKQKFSD